MEALNMGAAERLEIVEREEVHEKKVERRLPSWFESRLNNTYEGRCRMVVRDFMNGKQFKNVPVYGLTGDRGVGVHTFSTRKNGTELWMFKNNPSIRVHVMCAQKVNGDFIGNASSFMHMRNPKNGKVKPVGAGGRLKIQEVMGEAMPMFPFLVFKEAKLDINTFKIVERGPEEDLDLGRMRKDERINTHFIGAILFTIEDKNKEEHSYLFDIDRNDLARKRFNPFLSKLPSGTSMADVENKRQEKIKSIQAAYDLLKPQEVRDAERFMKEPCLRQGEWFFIPCAKQDYKPVTERTFNGGNAKQEAVLQSKGNRPHFVKEICEEGFVRGQVWHGGHEHLPVQLDKWCKAVPNTAIQSFTISGAVD